VTVQVLQVPYELAERLLKLLGEWKTKALDEQPQDPLTDRALFAYSDLLSLMTSEDLRRAGYVRGDPPLPVAPATLSETAHTPHDHDAAPDGGAETPDWVDDAHRYQDEERRQRRLIAASFAMQGLLSTYPPINVSNPDDQAPPNQRKSRASPSWIGSEAVAYGDALLSFLDEA